MECAIRLVIANSAWMLVAEAGCGVSMAANETHSGFILSRIDRSRRCWMLHLDLNACWRTKYRKTAFFFFFISWCCVVCFQISALVHTRLVSLGGGGDSSWMANCRMLSRCRMKHATIIVIWAQKVVASLLAQISKGRACLIKFSPKCILHKKVIMFVCQGRANPKSSQLEFSLTYFLNTWFVDDSYSSLGSVQERLVGKF